MAGTTTKGFRYPTASDAPAIHTAFLNLATDIDTFFDTPQVTTSVIFEGSTADAFETTLTVIDPTADRTITLPNVTGTVVTTGDTATVSAAMLVDTYQTTALAATAATTADTNAQNFSRVTVLMLGGM
jgi:hypothetical protein